MNNKYIYPVSNKDLIINLTFIFQFLIFRDDFTFYENYWHLFLEKLKTLCLSKAKLNLSFLLVMAKGPCDVLGPLEIMSQVTLGLYDTKSFYQWFGSITEEHTNVIYDGNMMFLLHTHLSVARFIVLGDTTALLLLFLCVCFYWE